MRWRQIIWVLVAQQHLENNVGLWVVLFFAFFNGSTKWVESRQTFTWTEHQDQLLWHWISTRKLPSHWDSWHSGRKCYRPSAEQEQDTTVLMCPGTAAAHQRSSVSPASMDREHFWKVPTLDPFSKNLQVLWIISKFKSQHKWGQFCIKSATTNCWL